MSNYPRLLPPVPGSPLIRSKPDLGWQMVRIKGTIDVESDLQPDTKKKRIYWAWKRFVEWQEKEDKKYMGGLVIHGPFPHVNLQEPKIQYGENGAKRPVARSVYDDIEPGKEDYVIEAHFLVREKIVSVPIDMAAEVAGKNGVRLARPYDLKGVPA